MLPPAKMIFMTNNLKLLLVDDHSLFREGLSRLLSAEQGLALAGEFANARDAISAMKISPADIVLLDYDLGDESGMVFLEEARRLYPATRILFVTAGMSDSDTLRALDRGAAGIFLKHSSPPDLLQAIRTVAAGETWLDPGAVQALVSAAKASQQKVRTRELFTARERAVLSAVFEGLTNKEIGARLGISEGYVKAVLQQLFSKTGVRSRSQLVRIALENRDAYGLSLEGDE